ncbi:hypothetical protein [Achromobacter sp.]
MKHHSDLHAALASARPHAPSWRALPASARRAAPPCLGGRA